MNDENVILPSLTDWLASIHLALGIIISNIKDEDTREAIIEEYDIRMKEEKTRERAELPNDPDLRVSATEDRQLAHASYDTLSKVLVYVGRNGVE